MFFKYVLGVVVAKGDYLTINEAAGVICEEQINAIESTTDINDPSGHHAILGDDKATNIGPVKTTY